MQTCLYQGSVYHVRRGPVEYRFRYDITMGCFDIDSLSEILADRRLLTDDRHAAISFPAAQHIRQYAGNLRSRVEQLLSFHQAEIPTGPIFLLTQLRYFGLYFSPLNLFFCHDPSTEEPTAIIAEVNNTPWGEQFHYLIRPKWHDHIAHAEHAKQFHVSPFMPMDHTYHWTFSTRDRQLAVQLENRDGNRSIFEAGMNLEEFPLDADQLFRLKVLQPAMTWKVMSAIYWQALKLWWKKCPIYPHPGKTTTDYRSVPLAKPASGKWLSTPA